jgi:hypothetical protein
VKTTLETSGEDVTPTNSIVFNKSTRAGEVRRELQAAENPASCFETPEDASLKTILETSGENVKITLEKSGEDVKITLETNGENVKITLEKSGEDALIASGKAPASEQIFTNRSNLSHGDQIGLRQIPNNLIFLKKNQKKKSLTK